MSIPPVIGSSSPIPEHNSGGSGKLKVGIIAAGIFAATIATGGVAALWTSIAIACAIGAGVGVTGTTAALVGKKVLLPEPKDEQELIFVRPDPVWNENFSRLESLKSRLKLIQEKRVSIELMGEKIDQTLNYLIENRIAEDNSVEMELTRQTIRKERLLKENVEITERANKIANLISLLEDNLNIHVKKEKTPKTQEIIEKSIESINNALIGLENKINDLELFVNPPKDQEMAPVKETPIQLKEPDPVKAAFKNIFNLLKPKK